MSIVSDNMKYLRKLHGMTQDQFSRRIGIKRASVGAYEEERANPNIDVLKTMSRLFNVSVDDLLKKDLRKIRETPSLLPLNKPQNTPLVSEPIDNEPQTLGAIFDQLYTPPSPTLNRQPPIVSSVPMPPAPPAPVIEPAKVVVQPSIPTYQAPASSAFNNVYNNGSNGGATMVQAPPNEAERHGPKSVQYVLQSQLKEYTEKFQQGEYLKRLPTFQMPLLEEGTYRAFEAGDDFSFTGALLIGQAVANWYDIADGKSYILVARNLGVVCRRVYNQVKIKGTLLLSSDKGTIPTFEVPLKDILEVWEIKAFFSQTLPEPTVSFDHLRNLVSQLQDELKRIKK